MNEHQPDKGRIVQVAARVAGEKRHPGLVTVSRRISGMTRELRARYMAVNGEARQEPQDIWLCDNYYVLEKESKQSLSELRGLRRRGDPAQTALLFAVVDAVIREAAPPLTDETAVCILEEVARRHGVGEILFAAYPTAVKAALLAMAHRACLETKDDKDIAYAITGFVRLTSLDMEDIVEACGGVEETLSKDPAGVYDRMTDSSRRHYRYLVSRVAEKRRQSEETVAADLLVKARSQPDGPRNHVGWWLLRSPELTAPRRRRGRWALCLQILAPLAASLLAGLWTGRPWIALLCYLPFWEILRPLITQFSLVGTDIDFLPRMDLKKAGDKPKTVVLVSTLVPGVNDAEKLSARLEQLYFSNSDPDLYYCILADFKESAFPTGEQDEVQVAATEQVIAGLNEKYDNRFMLFLRSRTYNKTQNKYSGWERKRGAITEFVRFLKGERTSVHTFLGDRSILPKIKFLIALDADTNLLYESAQTLVSVAMHPVNDPVWDERGVVTEGYGILAPKISTDLQSAKATSFSRVLSGCGGVTAYETRDKDFYQDLFGESIFAGKGLIHVDSFYHCLDKRFPENRVLSHDILEGSYLRCAFVSDVEMSDTSPANMTSWLSRLHRWLRGDWQNIVFLGRRYRAGGMIWENPINALSKFKLFDNLRRSFTCVVALLCLVLALFLPGRAGLVLALAGALAVCFPSFWAAANSLASGGLFTLARKFFTRTLPHAMELVAQGLLFLIMLPAQAFLTLDAVLRSLWRLFVSRKKLLEWTTAAQSDARKVTLRSALARYGLAELFGLAFTALSGDSVLLLAGVLFSLVLPMALSTAKPTRPEQPVLSDRDREALLSYNAAMWRFYEDFADASNNFLPPDNMQQSPVYRVAARTSPTNIGMMLLSILAARDMGFIDTGGLYRRVERTIASVERLETWHGNLLNWYDTQTLRPLHPAFVSYVDSGNFICSLVALKEGLREFEPKISGFGGLIKRIEALIDGCDLTVFYNEKKHLFSIGYDMEAQELSSSHYDFLMSESRMTSYYAVARKQVGKKHWGSLNRTMSRNGSYAGPVSWTGTMFEYFMPHLLLPVYEGSLLGESLTYCLYCQKKRTRARGIPWGISESAFYAFDNNLNYQYKAHGDPKLGVKRGLDRELVISPYSTFLTIPLNPSSSMGNLANLRELGVYGRYGFYEAVDFTEDRVGRDSLAVTRSYMAHHIGMSMLASDNALYGDIMQRRFMADHHMKSAKEFLEEKITKHTIIYDDLGAGFQPDREERPQFREASGLICPQAPKAMLLSNGELTDILTDSGAGYLKFGSADLTRRPADLLRHPQGFVAVLKCSDGFLPATLAPFFDDSASYTVETREQAVTYRAARGGKAAGSSLETSLTCSVHPTISCAQRRYTVKNLGARKETVDVLFYLEPVLCDNRDYSAHPAYSKLFVTAEFDEASGCLIFKRRNRDATENTFLAVGFLEDVPFTMETRREALMEAPDGLRGLLAHVGENLSGADHGVPDACAALSFRMTIPQGYNTTVTLFICAARSRSEGVEGIISMRNAGGLERQGGARSPLLSDSLEGRLGSALLSQLLFSLPGGNPDRRKNRLGQSSLWCTGVSGDYPIALIENPRALDEPVLLSYLRLHGMLRAWGVEFDLVVLCDGDEDIGILSQRVLEAGGGLMLGARGGIFLLNRQHLAPETITLFRAAARHFAIPKGLSPVEELVPRIPVPPRPVEPAPLPEQADLSVEGGAFAGGRFFVDKRSPLPWSHVLATPVFGTLVSDKSLGATWALNARENKLTPWSNDIATGNTGELALLRLGDEVYDLVAGSRASFAPEDARYEGYAGPVASTVTVTVRPKGCAKVIDIVLANRSDRELEASCAFYTEPVLGVLRDTARFISPEQPRPDVLVLRNPYNTAARCAAALTAHSPGNEVTFMTDRAAFLSGSWDGGSVGPENDPCAAVIVPMRLPPRREAGIRFILGYGQTEAAALAMVDAPSAPPPAEAGKNRILVNTPDEAINQLINTFVPHQILSSRIYGRCAFYQCGGAFGFRDQLQDVMAYLLLDPSLARRQIIRCCGVQFEEGDVFHWWHDLPASAGGLRGVRTKFSDDLLWLPLAAAEYVEKTGDASLLDVSCGYLAAEPLPDREHERYIAPGRSSLREDVYAHCVRALDRGHNLGENGLPLIGCGDWNDGFSSVGLGGKGTSVWLAMFLALALDRFAPLAEGRGDGAYAALCRERAEALRRTVDDTCWDGDWYVRAFFDDGSPMGSRHSEECRIDLLPQSFAVLASLPDEERKARALESAWNALADQPLKIARLFDPAFHHSRQRPGYVKAYPPGLRENGGQYTHAAVWFAMALLEQGETERGWELLRWINPAARSSDPDVGPAYKLEPYAIAADIYANPGAPGHGGWSLYTGAAAWYYRAVVEHLLGMRLAGDKVRFAPKLPAAWEEAGLSATLAGTELSVTIRRGGEPGLTCDGRAVEAVALDGGRHDVVVIL